MKLIYMEKVRDGKYLKNYELTYENKCGKEKKYEIISRKNLESADDLGKHSSGVSIIATYEDKFLLLHEFRMGVNKKIYNLCAGMQEAGESIEECIARELYEETGLKLKKIDLILPPSYAAVAISDTKTHIAFVEVEGIIEDHTSDNEEIEARFFTKEEVKELLRNCEFSSRAQMAAYFFAYGKYN